MKKEFKSWSAKIEKDGESRYEKVVARTATIALNWFCQNCDCELDDIAWLSSDPIDVAEEE